MSIDSSTINTNQEPLKKNRPKSFFDRDQSEESVTGEMFGAIGEQKKNFDEKREVKKRRMRETGRGKSPELKENTVTRKGPISNLGFLSLLFITIN